MFIPPRIGLANLPTPVQPMERLNPREDVRLFIKRDDFTGLEMSGNKVRKLDFTLCRGLEEGAEVFITCGALQSNHARATAAAAAALGKTAHLVLRGPETETDGNYFLDRLFGARVQFVTEEEYAARRDEIMEELRAAYDRSGRTGFVLPEGGSNGLGMFGYFQAFQEILRQERECGVCFDTLCVANGSGGTYAGLYAANALFRRGKSIVGFHIASDGAAKASQRIEAILREGAIIGGFPCPTMDRIQLIDRYAGDGYGIASPQVIKFIKRAARETGVALDPVYTGKALYGVVSELAACNPLLRGNVLFIHTGGQFGLFPQKNAFSF